MSTVFFILAFASMAGVVVSLFLGIGTMVKGGDTSGPRSNKMMRARVILQGAAVVFLVLGLAAMGR